MLSALDPALLIVLKSCLDALAAIVGAVAAWFAFLDVRHSASDAAVRRRPYLSAWKKIDATGILHLPERAVEWLFAAEQHLVDLVFERCGRSLKWLGIFFFAFIGICATVVGYIFRWPWALLVLVLDWWVGGFIFAIGAAPFGGMKFNGQVIPYARDRRSLAILSVAATVTFLYPAQATIVLSLVPIPNAFFLAVVLCALLLIITMVLYMIVENVGRGVGVLGSAFRLGAVSLPTSAISIFVTVAALTVGHLVDSAAPLPHTLRMIVVNVVCDGVTVAVALLLFAAALKSRKWYAVPLVVVLDSVIAGLLAWASLWFGVASVSAVEAWHVLLLRSPDGSGLQFGPYFWAMHTTFCPLWRS